MGEGQRKPRNRNETQPSKRVPGQGRRAGEPDTVLSGERQDVSLPSRGSQKCKCLPLSKRFHVHPSLAHPRFYPEVRGGGGVWERHQVT